MAGSNGGGSARAGDAAVLFDKQYVWPGDLTQIPDWVYTDEAIYQREVERIFHGPTWNYVALECRDPECRRFHSLQCRPDAGRRGAGGGRLDRRGREPLHASRRRVLPRIVRHGEGVRLPLSPMDLRPEGQPHRRAVPARAGRQGRHAGGLQDCRSMASRRSTSPRIAAWCSPPMCRIWSRFPTISGPRCCASSRRRSMAAS